MLDSGLVRIERALARSPRDPEAWAELGRFAARTGEPPRFLTTRRHLPGLLAAWTAMPRDRSLVPLALALLGLELASMPVEPRGSFWAGRALEAEDHWYDGVTGLPLEYTRPLDASRMLLVPPGAGWQGTDLGTDREGPENPVTLDGFLVDRVPVRVRAYQAFLDDAPDAPDPPWNLEVQRRKRERPVVAVTWHDAIAYASWAGAALPTEAEWERAARGVDRRLFPWGDESPGPGRANYRELHGPAAASPRATRGHAFHQFLMDNGKHPAGTSPFGVEDMLGNVAEWCADHWSPSYHRRGLRRNPKGPGRGERRVVRGGSWATPLEYLRLTLREGADPAFGAVDIGFRLVRRLPLPAPA